MLIFEDVKLRPALKSERDFLWYSIYKNSEWKQYDAPYYTLNHQSKLQFRRSLFKRLVAGNTAMVIDYNDKAVGYITCYWEDQETHWLEVGITIFYSADWNKQIGRKALILWITHLFGTLNIPRVGLSTWSGNPRMIKCAESIGMKQEGCLRQVRYYQGQYYDSIHYGVLQQEWQEFWFGRKISQTHDVAISQP